LDDQILLRQTLLLGGLPAATLEHALAALFDTATQLALVAERLAADPARPIPYGYLFK
jgi:hypothetical protein